jgi:hypothetical protein
MRALRLLRWYDWLWCALPLGLLATDWFGALCGLAAFAFNLRTFASEQDRRMKYMLAALATVTAISVYLIVGLLFVAILTPGG